MYMLIILVVMVVSQVHMCVCDDGFTSVYVCQSLLDHTLCVIYYQSYFSNAVLENTMLKSIVGSVWDSKYLLCFFVCLFKDMFETITIDDKIKLSPFWSSRRD